MACHPKRVARFWKPFGSHSQCKPIKGLPKASVVHDAFFHRRLEDKENLLDHQKKSPKSKEVSL
jgi:hypothetical protein